MISESPWQKHGSSLSWEELPSSGDAGVVALGTNLWPFGSKKPGEQHEANSLGCRTHRSTLDPQIAQAQKDNAAENKNLEAMLIPSLPISNPTNSANPTPLPPGGNAPQPGTATGLVPPLRTATPTNSNGMNLGSPPTAASIAPVAFIAPSAAAIHSQPMPSTSSSSGAALSSSGMPPMQPTLAPSVP